MKCVLMVDLSNKNELLSERIARTFFTCTFSKKSSNCNDLTSFYRDTKSALRRRGIKRETAQTNSKSGEEEGRERGRERETV